MPSGKVDCGNREVVVGAVHQLHGVSCLDGSGGVHSPVPAGSSRVLELHGEVLDTPAACDLVARAAGLGSLQDDTAESPAITDAHGCLIEPMQGEVLAEATGTDRRVDVSAPKRIVGCGVGADGLVGSTVDAQVSLLIALKAVGVDDDGIGHRTLEDGACPRPAALGGNGTGLAYVDSHDGWQLRSIDDGATPCSHRRQIGSANSSLSSRGTSRTPVCGMATKRSVDLRECAGHGALRLPVTVAAGGRPPEARRRPEELEDSAVHARVNTGVRQASRHIVGPLVKYIHAVASHHRVW